MLEKTRHVAEVRLDPDDVSEQSAADAGHDVRMAGATFEVQQRRATPERHTQVRSYLPFGRRLCRTGHQKRQRQKCDPHQSCVSYDPGENSRRNRRPNGETVRSPAPSPNVFTRPLLFESRISVSPRAGSMTKSDDEAFSLTPNCQTTGSPL